MSMEKRLYEPIEIHLKVKDLKGELTPFWGEVTVIGSTVVRVNSENPESFPEKLRAIVAAMYLTNEMGKTQFDVPNILKQLAERDNDETYVRSLFAAAKHRKPKCSGEYACLHAAFVDAIPGQSEGMSKRPCPVSSIEGHTCSSADQSQQEDPDGE